MMRYLLLILLFCISTCSLSDARAEIIWNITYEDTAGVGFNDAIQGAARKATFEAALTYVSSVLNENGTVNFTVQASQTDGSGFLAAAGSAYNVVPGFQQGAVQQQIQQTTAFNGTAGSAQFDFGFNWNASLAAPTGGQFDLFTVALHEITHALGFGSLIDQTGESQFNNGLSGTFSNFDAFLRTNSTPFFTGNTFTATADLNSNGTVDVLESNQVLFVGANAIAANGGNGVAIYSPSTYAPGSSISHITNPAAVMQFSIAPGISRRTYTNVEIGILKDLGYNNIGITAVPEPSSLAAVGLVLALATLSRLRRRCVTDLS